MPDASEKFFDVAKNQREILRISRRDFKGHDLISFNILFRDAAGELRFGKGGFGISAEAAPAIIEALQQLCGGVRDD